MALPYSLEKKYNFPNKELVNFSITDFKTNIIKQFSKDKIIENTKNEISISSNNSLVNFNFIFEILFDEKEPNSIKTVINLVNLLKISIVLLVFIALFSKFAFQNFLIFSAVFFLIFYLLNVLFIVNYINKNINKTLVNIGYNTESDNYETQSEWSENLNKCPACGIEISDTNIICPSCGLKLKQNAYTKPLNLSQNNTEQSIKYTYKPKINS
jgi:hypothetical protein